MHLKLAGISKDFPGVKALSGISFDLRPGEVHALCGENGAGKSTLMNILAGNLKPDTGEIRLDNKVVKISDPTNAAQLGIAIVYQQLSLVETLSVAENIFANNQPVGRFGLIKYKLLYAQTKQLLKSLNIDYILPETLVTDLSPGEKQMVEIAKALSKNPEILILDEPTASISERETKTLFNLIGQLKLAGKSVIYISHRMAEIFRISDRITILKDGQYQGTFDSQEISPEQLIRRMVGRDLVKHANVSTGGTEELLSVKNLSGSGFTDINFSLRKGEILGFAGLVGAGRTEIAQTIFGFRSSYSGEILIKGKALKMTHPADAIAAGIGYVPEERKSQGLFLNKSVIDNIIVTGLCSTENDKIYNSEKANASAEKLRRDLKIITPDLEQQVINLSGGNQQKVVLAKWLLTDPEILIVDEPTHGIDVGAKAEIYDLLRKLAASGKGIIVISSELTELLGLADRIIVIRQGQISGILDGRLATEEMIMSMATI